MCPQHYRNPGAAGFFAQNNFPSLPKKANTSPPKSKRAKNNAFLCVATRRTPATRELRAHAPISKCQTHEKQSVPVCCHQGRTPATRELRAHAPISKCQTHVKQRVPVCCHQAHTCYAGAASARYDKQMPNTRKTMRSCVLPSRRTPATQVLRAHAPINKCQTLVKQCVRRRLADCFSV